MTTRRRFSRNIRKARLAKREDLETTLAALLGRALEEHDPLLPPSAVRIAAFLGAAVVSQMAVQTQFVHRTLRQVEDLMPEYAADFVSDIVAAATQTVGKQLKRFKAAPAASSPATALPLPEDWAGPVAGPTVIERHYGIPRSTLYRWQKRDEAVAINSRTSSKPVFPLRQFLDGRPVEGLAEIIAIFGEQRAAWAWLMTRHSAFAGKLPIDRLLEGRAAEVSQLARLDHVP